MFFLCVVRCFFLLLFCSDSEHFSFFFARCAFWRSRVFFTRSKRKEMMERENRIGMDALRPKEHGKEGGEGALGERGAKLGKGRKGKRQRKRGGQPVC